MAAAVRAPHLARLAALCRAAPVHGRKTVIVPMKQIGRTAGAALAAAGVSWVNLETVTLAEHAAARTLRRARRDGLRALPGGADLLLVDALLEAHPHLAADLGGHAAPGLARALLSTIRTLRSAGLAPDDLAGHVRGARPRAVAGLYAAYVDHLVRHRLLDEAAVFELALGEDISAGDPGVLAVFDDVELPALHRRYLDKLRRVARRGVRITHGGAAEPPEGTAAALLRDDPDWEVQDVPAALAARTWHFGEAVGAACEVRAVLRGILERELPLDTVEVAYPVHDPYLVLFLEAAHRHDLPVTLAAGAPLGRTRTGQALVGFCRWIEEGLGIRPLVRLLRGGFIATDRLPGLPAPVAPHEVASLAAEHGAGEGREAFVRLDRAIERASEAAGHTTRAKMDAARAVLDRLLRLAPPDETMPAERMAAVCMGFLRLFGPSELPPGKRATDYTPDEHALDVLLQRLAGLGDAAGVAGRPDRLAGRIREMASGAFVGARAARAGHLHVVPLSSAGYSGRPHLFVVGMDEARFSTRPVQDPLLLDRERERLAGGTGAVLPLEGDRRSASSFHFERAAAAAVADVTLLTNVLDLEANRPLARSAAYIEALRHARGTPVRHAFAPSGDDALAADDLELQLLMRTCRSQTTEALLRRAWPGAGDGRAADAARAGGEVSVHDGWLGADHAGAEGLDPLEVKLSASRLEDLTKCPYRFFLKYVLGLRPPREKELEIGEALDALEQGSVLHGVFERYMRTLGDRKPTPDDREAVQALLHDELETRHEARLRAHPAAARVLRRRLGKSADVFLNAEVRAADERTPLHLELGFGLDPGEARTDRDHEGDLVVELEDGLRIRLKGWIDRVDRGADGTLEVWDYKTGSHKRFVGSDLLQNGDFLQWALYGYALEVLFPGERVGRAGYYFTSARGAGQRLADDPKGVRGAVAALVRQRTDMARTALFPPAPDGNTCKYCDYARVCGPHETRKAEMKGKLGDGAAAHACGDHLNAWGYG